MAITVGEEKKFNWKWVIGILLFFGLAGGVAYIIFAQPELVEIVAPAELKKTTDLSNIQFDPAKVLNSESFRSLKRYGTDPTVGQLGRPNPFISY